MIAAALFGALLWWRGRLFETRWYLTIVANTWWVGFVAVIAGWMVTESGRQPWIVHGMLRTADAVSPVPAGSVLATLILFVVVYLIVFSFGAYFINRLIARGMQDIALPERTPELASGRAHVRELRPAMDLESLLPLIWAAIIGFAVALYVILDGFDLGIGMLFPFARDDAERDRMLSAIAPFWDGNETWLVLGGGGLLGGVPARLRDRHAGVLPTDHGDAAGAGVSRRHLRIPRHGAEQAVLEFRLRRRLDAGRLLPGADPRRAHARRQDREWRLCRRRVRLGDAVRGAVRARRCHRLCAARHHLADDEDRRRHGGPRCRQGQGPADRRARVHDGGEHLHAAGISAHRPALVHAAEPVLSAAGTVPDRAGRARRVVFHRRAARSGGRSSPPSRCSCSAMSAWRSRPIPTLCRRT